MICYVTFRSLARVWGCVFSGWVGFGGVVVFRIMEISYVGVVLGSGTL